MTPFQHTVSTEQELRELLGQPSRLVQNKVIHRLDGHCRTFIHASPLLFLSTGTQPGAAMYRPVGISRGLSRYWMIPTFSSPTGPEIAGWIPCGTFCRMPTWAWCF